jgi:hypothetical protein
VVWAPGGSPSPLLLATSVFWPNRTSGYFPRIANLHKYGVLPVLFLAESWLRQWILQ